MLIIIILIIIISAFILIKLKTKKKISVLNKVRSTKKRIKNINKHLKIADASVDLHEVRMHARKAMTLIKRYGLVEEYRKLLKNK